LNQSCRLATCIFQEACIHLLEICGREENH
jgi:hypothetical protein